jgi:putative ABC transport system ATP-binding protein
MSPEDRTYEGYRRTHAPSTLATCTGVGAATTREAALSTPATAPAHGQASDVPLAARARALTKAYGSGETTVRALDAVDVDIARGRFTAVMGPSGSGKSTLMHCLAGLDTVSAGQVWLGDTEITGLKDRELTRLRRDRIGFMFQAFNLLPTLTAAENITLPMDIAGRKPDSEWVEQVIDTLGLRDRLRHRPAQLSGGQQQRVACARALASRPELIFADEPTGNLDSRAGAEVLTFLREAVDRLDQTVVMVTHDPGAAAYSDLVLFLADGRIVDVMQDPTAEAVLERMRLFSGAQPQTPGSDALRKS